MFPLGPLLGEGSNMAKKLPSGLRLMLKQKPWHQGDARGPSKSARLLVVLEGEPRKTSMPNQHRWVQPAQVSQMVASSG